MSGSLCGGISQKLNDADDTVREICEKIKDQVIAKLGRQTDEFTPLKYKTQLVNGVNYFIKVKVGGAEHIHVRAHKSFQGDVTYHSHQENKQEDEEIAYF